MSEEEAVVVFTARSPERIISEGGSQAWVLNAARAKLCKWLVCTQNRNNRDHEFSDATEGHGAAFLVGKVSGVVKTAEQSEDGRQRWLVTISAYALVNIPDFWAHDRNPVRYLSRSELKAKGLNPDALSFAPAGQSSADNAQPKACRSHSSAGSGMTIAQARDGLATTFGVRPDAIEITIRG